MDSLADCCHGDHAPATVRKACAISFPDWIPRAFGTSVAIADP